MLYRKSNSAVVAALCLIAAAGNGAAGDITKQGRATVTLLLRHRTLLYPEQLEFTIRLRNDSNRPLPVITHPHVASGKQVFIKMDPHVPVTHVDPKPKPGSYGDKIWTVEEEGRWEVVLKTADAVLRRGETIEWDGTELDPLHFYMWEGQPKGIQAQILVGPGEWVSSKMVHFKTLHVDVRQFPVVFESVSLFAPQLVRESQEVRCIPIEGREYLFLTTDEPVARICEVPKGARLGFRWDPFKALLTVMFHGTDTPPVQYDCRMLRRVTSRKRPTGTRRAREPAKAAP